MYLANKVQNIQGAADTLLDLAELTQEEIRPVAEAMERGGRLAAKAEVTDAILDKCKPIAGTPDDCIARDRGVPRGRLHARHAGAVGRRPARADPPLRRTRCCRTSDERSPIDRDRLVDTATEMVNVHSFTGDEQRMADLMASIFDEMGLQVQRQQVEDNRANALGTWPGAGGGKSLMFNGHMDTSYSGREPWLRGVPGFQPSAFERDGPALRARDLEHEGRARLLRRGGPGAAGREASACAATC